MHTVFVLNCGSSSIKFQIIDCFSQTPIFKGSVERINTKSPILKIGTKTSTLIEQNYEDILDKVFSSIPSISLDGIGHRVVHGGKYFTSPVKITSDTLEKIKTCISLAPIHNPKNIIGIEIGQKYFPNIDHVAVFDTAFHHTIPEKAYMYAIPRELYEHYGIRRYGFHGISHQYLAKKGAELLSKPIEETSIISCHLGNGSSICAIKNGKSVDVSMGFTPTEGLVMGERCGSIDPGIIPYICDKMKLSPQNVYKILNTKSGLLGLSGESACMEQLLQSANAHAKLAVEIFCYSAAKYILSFIAPLDCVDAILFTGGIGENSEVIRSKILGYLKPFDFNHFVCVSNEEQVIALDAAKIIKAR